MQACSCYALPRCHPCLTCRGSPAHPPTPFPTSPSGQAAHATQKGGCRAWPGAVGTLATQTSPIPHPKRCSRRQEHPTEPLHGADGRRCQHPNHKLRSPWARAAPPRVPRRPLLRCPPHRRLPVPQQHHPRPRPQRRQPPLRRRRRRRRLAPACVRDQESDRLVTSKNAYACLQCLEPLSYARQSGLLLCDP